MKFTIKDFSAIIDKQTQGIEIGVRKSDKHKHLGDFVVTSKELIWCDGQTQPFNGHSITLEKLIEHLKTLPKRQV